MTHAAQVLLGLASVLAGPVDDGRVAASPVPEEPLLVIVERIHGATASPEQVRRAIAEELGRPVVGPTDAAAKGASQMLIVTLAPDSVAMQMRSAGDAAPRRRVEPLAGGESNLRVVAWLAGNLARDQAGELMDALPAAGLAATPPPTAAPPPPVTPTQPPPPSVDATPAAPAAVTTKPPQQPPRPDAEAPWRLELSSGQQVRPWQYLGLLPRAALYGFEVVAPSRPGKWSWTAGFDVSTDARQNNTYFIASGLSRRFALVPGWLAADTGWGLGLVLGNYEAWESLGGDMYRLSHETVGPNLLAQLSVTLAFVRFRLGEIVAGARFADSPEAIKQPWFAFSAGLRIALQ